MEPAMDLMRRMPPGSTETALNALLSLLPDHSLDLLSQVDLPLQVCMDKENNKEYILCEYNRDADSYRSPWSNIYEPPLEDGTVPSEEMRNLEVEANEVFSVYRDQYYEGGISSVYIWEDEDESFIACFLIKKDGQGKRGYMQIGSWDAIHVIQVGPEEEGAAHYCLNSTVMLSLTTDNKQSGTFNLSGSIRRQMSMTLAVADGHLVNMVRRKTLAKIRMGGANGAKAYGAVVLIRVMYSGMHIMSKIALDQGMNPFVFVFYRHTTAALVLIPIAFALERQKTKPVTLKIAGKMFVHALYGVTACGVLFNLGLNYASATSSSALYNVQPVVTFILAVIIGMESMKLKKLHGNLKVAGILCCVAGVTVLAFYEGPMFRSFNHHRLFQHGSGSSSGAGTYSKNQWVFGIFLMTLSNILAGLWTVLQGPLIEDTSKLMNTTLQISCASVQAFVVAVAAERDFSKWKIGWNISLAAIIYSGVIVTALSYYMQMWTIAKRGPVFLAMSMPLTLIFTIIISSFVLGETVSLGSIIAGVLLIGGLYNVLWGKSMERKDETNKMGGGKPAMELQDKEQPQVPDDAAAKV